MTNILLSFRNLGESTTSCLLTIYGPRPSVSYFSLVSRLVQNTLNYFQLKGIEAKKKMRIITLVACWACLSLLFTSAASKKSSRAGEDLRLPRNVLPRSYEVTLLPILIEGNFTTEGSVNIVVDCVQASNNVTLHIADITWSASSVSVTSDFICIN